MNTPITTNGKLKLPKSVRHCFKAPLESHTTAYMKSTTAWYTEKISEYEAWLQRYNSRSVCGVWEGAGAEPAASARRKCCDSHCCYKRNFPACRSCRAMAGYWGTAFLHEGCREGPSPVDVPSQCLRKETLVDIN